MAERAFHLRVGEAAELERGLPIWLGLGRGRVSLIYAGMPSESTYSLAVTYTSGYNSVAYNLYLPVTTTGLEIAKGRLQRVEATRASIDFRYVKL